MEYEGTVYRPPSEARSLIIQVTVGCAHNRCTFCNMYRVKKFRVRTKEEIMKDLDECRDYYGPYVSRVFFADGDALVVKTELLLELLAYVHKNFPYVERITSYGTAKDVLAKSEETEQEDSEDPQFPYNRNSSLCILLLKSVTDYINDSQKKATEQSTDMCGIIDSCFHAIYQIVAYEKKDTN